MTYNSVKSMHVTLMSSSHPDLVYSLSVYFFLRVLVELDFAGFDYIGLIELMICMGYDCIGLHLRWLVLVLLQSSPFSAFGPVSCSLSRNVLIHFFSRD